MLRYYKKTKNVINSIKVKPLRNMQVLQEIGIYFY